MRPAHPVRLVSAALLLMAALAMAQPPVPPGDQKPSPPPTQPPAAGQPKLPQWPKEIGGKSAAEWVASFRDPDPTEREAAVKIIAGFGPDARKVAVKPLISLIASDPDPGVKINAILVLGTIGVESREDVKSAAEAIATLMDATRPGSVIRLHGCRVLASFGTDAHMAIGAVNRMADDSSWETRQAAAFALGRLGAPVYGPPPATTSATPPAAAKPPAPKRPANKTALNKLCNSLLKDTSALVRIEACQALLALGPPYSPDPAEYIKLVQPYANVVAERLKEDNKGEKDPMVRVWVYLLSCMYDDRTMDSSVAKITKQVMSPDQSLRIQALSALAVLGPKAKVAMPEIRATLKVPEPPVISAAISTLLAMGEDGKLIASELDKLGAESKNKDLKELYTNGARMLREGVKREEDRKKEMKK
jgi:HEAT repeat protein